jgi:hypothetical protein
MNAFFIRKHHDAISGCNGDEPHLIRIEDGVIQEGHAVLYDR